MSHGIWQKQGYLWKKSKNKNAHHHSQQKGNNAQIYLSNIDVFSHTLDNEHVHAYGRRNESHFSDDDNDNPKPDRIKAQV